MCVCVCVCVCACVCICVYVRLSLRTEHCSLLLKKSAGRLRMMYAKLCQSGMESLLVHCEDADIFIMLLGHLSDIRLSVYIRTGPVNKDRIIAVNYKAAEDYRVV